MENQVITGDSLQVLKTLPDESIQCCVTSPPYWGLRDYGTAKWEGGSEECEHKPDIKPRAERPNITNAGIGKGDYLGHSPIYKDTCGKCGAIRIDNQLGLESTPEEYVKKMVEIFREVRRVLRKDGTLWLNLGDSYCGGGRNQGNSIDNTNHVQLSNISSMHAGKSKIPNGLKPKDLVGIPWRVAFALQADGWYLRQDIIWYKPNPMPESVTDRCTKAHEYIFLMTKSGKYYYDNESVKEASAESSFKRWAQDIDSQKGSDRVPFKSNGNMKAVAVNCEKRNRRSVWTVTTKCYKDAHFATFPPDLIEPCILAGSKAGDTVLDPFAGSGTTLAVAIKHNRHSIGIELNPEYVKLIHKRLINTQVTINFNSA
jgi:DNA modification methylase